MNTVLLFVERCLLFSFLMLLTCFCYAQKDANKKQKFLYYFDSSQKNIISYTKRNNIEKILFIDEHAFSTGKLYGFDKKKLYENITTLYPTKLETGYCYIDLESPYIDALINDEPSSRSFNESLSYFIKIISEAKKIRPNIKWGFYGIPFSTYWDLHKDFFKKYEKLKPLLQVSDVLFPSMYFFYSDEEPNGFMNKKFVIKNTQELIKVAIEYSIPVFPFIMERYHPSNQRIGYEKIPEYEFLKYMRVMLSESVQGNKIDGIVWWNADKYYYQSILGYGKNLENILKSNNDLNLRLMKKINRLIRMK